MEFQYLPPFPVRFSDIDMLGHVNNAVYLSYLEVARVEFWAAQFGEDGWARMPYLVGDAYVRYLAPILLRTRIELGIRFAAIGNKSFVLEYQVRNADTGQVMAEARTTQVMVDKDGRTYPVPDEVRRKAAELGVPDAWPATPGA